MSKEKKQTNVSRPLSSQPEKSTFAFTRENYRLMLIGCAVIATGMILMMGGGSDDPNKFSAEELFSHRRITVAPVVILAGFAVVLFSIIKRPKPESQQ